MARCLVIDDDRLFQQITADILNQSGFQSSLASSGREGWQKLITEEYELILLDLHLPDVTGYELLDRLADRNLAGRVIVVTSNFSLDSALRVLRTGAGDYLPKPFSPEALMTSVERVLRRNRLHQENQALQLQLRERVEELKTMRFITQLVASTRPMGEWIQEVVNTVCNWLGAEAGSLLLLDADGNLVFEQAIGPAAGAVSKVSLSRQQGGIAWWCLENRQPVVVNDASADARFNRNIDHQSGYRTRNVIAAPIFVQDRPVGVIEVINKKGGASFSSRDLSRLEELSSSIAVAVLNASMVKDLQKSQQELAEWNQRLEKTVEERTRQLQKADEERQEAYQKLLQSHEQLRQMQAALLEREKNASLGRLSAAVAHEINNPLSFIRANLDTLKNYVRNARQLVALLRHARSRFAAGDREKVALLLEEAARVIKDGSLQEIDEELPQIFEETADGLGRIAYVVEQLRYFSEDAPPSEQMQPVDLVAEIKRTAELVDLVRRRKGLNPLELNLSPLPMVLAPLRTVRQILADLLGAELGNGSAGQSKISCGEAEELVWIEIFCPQCGFSEEEVSRIFDPLFIPSGKTAAGGLSLSAAWGSARRIGGSLSARRDGSGLSFRLELKPARQ